MSLTTALMQPYSIENVRATARDLIGMFRREEVDAAVLDASRAQEATGVAGRVQIYAAANLDNCSPTQFDEMLLYLRSFEFKPGPKNEGRALYPTWEAALLGRTAGENSRQHAAFFVYDSNAAVIVDYVNRNGRSLMNPARRQQYLSFLQSQFGESLEWRTPKEEPFLQDEFQ